MLKKLLVGRKGMDIAPCPPPKYATEPSTASFATPTSYRPHQYHPSHGLPGLEGDRGRPGDRPKKADQRQRPRLPSERPSQRRTGEIPLGKLPLEKQKPSKTDLTILKCSKNDRENISEELLKSSS